MVRYAYRDRWLKYRLCRFYPCYSLLYIYKEKKQQDEKDAQREKRNAQARERRAKKKAAQQAANINVTINQKSNEYENN